MRSGDENIAKCIQWTCLYPARFVHVHMEALDIVSFFSVSFVFILTLRIISFGFLAPLIYKCGERKIKPGGERFILDVISPSMDKLVCNCFTTNSGDV